MQGNELKKLAEYLKEAYRFSDVRLVTRAEFGPDDKPLTAYIRPDADSSAKSIYKEGSFTTGLYLLVGEVDCDPGAAAKELVKLLEDFPYAAIRWTDVGLDSEAIYINETGEALRQDVAYIAIFFEMKTLCPC